MKHLIINHKCLLYSDAVRKNSLTQNETDDRIEAVFKDWLNMLVTEMAEGKKERQSPTIHQKGKITQKTPKINLLTELERLLKCVHVLRCTEFLLFDVFKVLRRKN